MTYLVLRLTTLSNVAMTVPVMASLSRRYPNDTFIVVARKTLGAMFYGMHNVHFYEVKNKGIKGLYQLYTDLKRFGADGLFDLQDDANTRFLRRLFRLRGMPIYHIHYGRWSKRWMTLQGAEKKKPLCSEFERYQQTFMQAGLETDNDFTALEVNLQAQQNVYQRFGEKKGKWIGIAPFAKSKSNMLPYRVTKQLIQRLSNEPNTQIFLFGAGKIECEMLRQWASVFPSVHSVAGNLTLEQELELMRRLDLMICMDSANRHLSALVNLRAVSIWCATHPHLGFMGWKQETNDIVQRQNVRCRPCTCHGTDRCRYHNFACREIDVEQIVQHII